MKSMMVGSALVTLIAQGTRCAHPLTRANEKTRLFTISLQERRTQPQGGPNQNIAAAALDVIGWNGPFNLATTDKNDCRDKQR